MDPIKGKTVVITGASEGIGKSLAQEMAQQGARIILLARSVDKIKLMEFDLIHKNYLAEAFPLDLTSDESIRETFAKILKKYSQIDLLINNAAVGYFDQIADTKEDAAKIMFQTNFFGPLKCVQQVLPGMRTRKSGGIVNISSAISKHSSFNHGIYAASKSSLDRLSEALRIEEDKNNIKVYSIFVDRTKTKFKEHVLGSKETLMLPFEDLNEADPDNVAQKIIAAIENNKYIYHTSLKSKLFALGSGVFPLMVSKLFAQQYQKIEDNKVRPERDTKKQ
ncbi:MAG TPA: SDR family NAD(P)-dependent oxidoreductase [Candidatus Nanoarchaeia archaeon]|nr:SDR family NAD(P)-dependent oxidoreductase [Candidatus Nanoarchaeia archaeon]